MGKFLFNPLSGQMDQAGGTSLTLGTSAGTACAGDDPRLSDTREWIADTISQAEAETGTSTTRRAFTALRVFQAIAAWWSGSAAKTKLDGIASGATANSSDATLLARANHTGTQAASTITGLATVATTGVYSDLTGKPTLFDPASPGAIGGTSAAAGTFTTLTANNGTITASAPVLDLAQTWNNSGVTFTGLRLNVTNTASGSSSVIADLLVGSSRRFAVFGSGASVAEFGDAAAGLNNEITIWGNGAGRNHRLIGQSSAGIAFGYGTTVPTATINNGTPTGFRMNSGGALTWTDNSSNATSGTVDTFLRRDAANTLAQYNSTNPQNFRLYSTVSGTNNANFERLAISAQAADSFLISTQKGGTGSARGLVIRTDDTARLTFGASGTVTLNTTLAADAQNISTDATTGTKICTGTTQKLGFWNAAPSGQPTAVADATDAASTQARLNDLLARLRTIGIIAT